MIQYKDFFILEASEPTGRGAEIARSRGLEHLSHGLWYKKGDPKRKVVGRSQGDHFYEIEGDNEREGDFDPEYLAKKEKEKQAAATPKRGRGRPPKPTGMSAKQAGTAPSNTIRPQDVGMKEPDSTYRDNTAVNPNVSPSAVARNPLTIDQAPEAAIFHDLDQFETHINQFQLTPEIAWKAKTNPRGSIQQVAGFPPGFYAPVQDAPFPSYMYIDGEFRFLKGELRSNVRDMLTQYKQKHTELRNKAVIGEPKASRELIRKALINRVKTVEKTAIKNVGVYDNMEPTIQLFKEFTVDAEKFMHTPSEEQAIHIIDKYGLKTNSVGKDIYLTALNNTPHQPKIRKNNQMVPADLSGYMNSRTAQEAIMGRMQALLGQEKFERLVPVKNFGMLMGAENIYEGAEAKALFDFEKNEQGQITKATINGIPYEAVFTNEDGEKLQTRLMEKLEEFRARVVIHEILSRRKGEPTASPETQARAAKLTKIIKTHNKRIQCLQQIADYKFADLSKFEGNTQQEQISNAMISAIDKAYARTRIPQTAESQAAKEAIQKLANCKDGGVEFEQLWINEVRPALLACKETKETISFLCEGFSAMRQAIKGKRVFIPVDDRVAHLDVVGLRNVNIRSFSDLEKAIDDIEMLDVSVDLSSVKQGSRGNKGAAASAIKKIPFLDFDYSKIDPKDVQYIMDQSRYDIRGIVNTGNDDPFSDDETELTTAQKIGDIKAGHVAAMDRFHKFVNDHSQELAEYFHLPTMGGQDISTSLYRLLTNGVRPTLGANGVPTSTPSKPLQDLIRSRDPQSKLNEQTFRLWSLYGHLNEFIMNTKINVQASSNETYTDYGISTSDGIDAPTIFEFSFSNLMRERQQDRAKVPKGSFQVFMKTGTVEDQHHAYASRVRTREFKPTPMKKTRQKATRREQ